MTAHPRWRALARTALAMAGAVALSTLGAGVAEAHVTAQPGQAAKGGYAVVALRIPTESDTAGTVKVQLTLPAQHPIAAVLTAPMPGWTEHLTTAPVNPPLRTDDGTVSEVVRTITWTAQPGTRVGPGQYADFNVSMGPLPEDVDQLVLPIAQTYDNGTVVRWDQPRAAGGAEPEHPAPTLALVAGTSAGAGGQGGHGAATAGPTTADGSVGGSDTAARWLGGAGLLVGVIGLVVALGAAGRARRRPPSRHMPGPRGTDRRVTTSSGGRRST